MRRDAACFCVLSLLLVTHEPIQRDVCVSGHPFGRLNFCDLANTCFLFRQEFHGPASTETQLSNYNQQHKRAAPPKNTQSENHKQLVGRHDQVQVPTNQRANAAIGKCMRALYSAANAPLYDHVFVSAIQRIHTRI